MIQASESNKTRYDAPIVAWASTIAVVPAGCAMSSSEVSGLPPAP
jgi:hypothetical protein